MKKLFYTIVVLFLATALFAQTSVNRVLILNEGYFDYFTNEIITPVSVAAYYPETEEYVQLHEIADARFASDIKISGNEYFVAADKFLIKYNLLTDEMLASTEVQGIRKIAVQDNYVVITRGEYLIPLSSYIQVYDKNTFNLVFEIPADELNYTTEGVLIKDNTAYIAVNNGFNFGEEVGMIAKVDLVSHELLETISLGEEGINPDNLMTDGETIFTINNKDYTGSSVSVYKISTGELSTENLLNISAGCGTSVYFDGNIYYQELFGTSVSKYAPFALELIGEKEFGKSFYALAFDETHALMYTSETDYFSYGKIHVYDLEGTEIRNFDAGISPGNIIFDIRTSTAVNTFEQDEMSLHPNPAADFVTIESVENILSVRITDVQGKVLDEATNIFSHAFLYDTNKLTAGNYFVTVSTEHGTAVQLLFKL